MRSFFSLLGFALGVSGSFKRCLIRLACTPPSCRTCAFIASTQTPRRLVRNIATMCSISARAARSAVWVMAAALGGSNAKRPPRWRERKNAEQMLCCHFCLSASACDEAFAVSGSASDSTRLLRRRRIWAFIAAGSQTHKNVACFH